MPVSKGPGLLCRCIKQFSVFPPTSHGCTTYIGFWLDSTRSVLTFPRVPFSHPSSLFSVAMIFPVPKTRTVICSILPTTLLYAYRHSTLQKGLTFWFPVGCNLFDVLVLAPPILLFHHLLWCYLYFHDELNQ